MIAAPPALWLVPTLFLLASCTSSPDPLASLPSGPPPPEGTPQVEEAIDGLIVGHRLMESGEYELALRAFGRALAEHGISADVLTAIGSANLRLGRLRQARRYLEMAVERDPEFAAAWNNLGVVLSGLGDLVAAEQAFRLAFSLDAGQSNEIRDNLALARANLDAQAEERTGSSGFSLVRRGNGRYLLINTPENRDN